MQALKTKRTVNNLGHSKFIVGTLAIILPGLAQANAGVPMLFLVMPVFGIALVPIIIVESIYLSKRLLLTRASAAKIVTTSNLVSTIVGIPLTWLLLVVVQMATGGGGAYGVDTAIGKVLAVTWQAPWLIPYEQEMDWMLPVAGIVLLIPFFFASWWSEYFVSRKMLLSHSNHEIKVTVRNANLISYNLLAIWPLSMLLFNYGIFQ